MALNSDGVMLLAPGMLWGMLRERPVPLEALEVLEPDTWACVATTDWATPSRLPLAQCDGQTQCAFHVTALVTFLPWWCAILVLWPRKPARP